MQRHQVDRHPEDSRRALRDFFFFFFDFRASSIAAPVGSQKKAGAKLQPQPAHTGSTPSDRIRKPQQ